MSDDAAEKIIKEIHQAFEQAEYCLAKLGDDIHFLVGVGGRIQIVRRTRKGQTAKPEVVVAELKGVDPLLWQPLLPSWLCMLSAAPMVDEGATAPADEPPPSDDDGEPGGPTPETL